MLKCRNTFTYEFNDFIYKSIGDMGVVTVDT